MEDVFYEHSIIRNKRLKKKQRMEVIWDYFKHLTSVQAV